VNKAIILAIACSAAIAGVSHAQTAADSAAIKECALNYIEGWYEGSAERMERALHPELAKRIVGPSRETGESALRNMTADQLIEATAAGYGTRTPGCHHPGHLRRHGCRADRRGRVDRLPPRRPMEWRLEDHQRAVAGPAGGAGAVADCGELIEFSDMPEEVGV
jgi:hypothetical protein